MATANHDINASKLEEIVANKRAIDYLQNIDFKTLGRCVFRDHLATVSEAGKNIGELTVTIEETVREKMICYHVHAQSHGELDNVPMGTSVSAYVSKGLVTLEQTQHEYIKFPEKPLDKKTVLIKNDDDEYQVRRTVSEGEETVEIEKCLTSLKGFISEGANIILQRVMSMREDVPERAVFLSLDVNLEVCAMKYEQLEDRSLEIENEKLQIFGIQRLQYDRLFDPIMTWHTYFLRDGHMANRITLGSPVRMQLVSLPRDESICDEAETTCRPRRELHWQEDIELHSKFLDRKENLMASHSTYLSRRPEVRALLEDFCQFVLLRKPEDVCSFAADYFASFSTKLKTAMVGEEN